MLGLLIMRRSFTFDAFLFCFDFFAKLFMLFSKSFFFVQKKTATSLLWKYVDEFLLTFLRLNQGKFLLQFHLQMKRMI